MTWNFRPWHSLQGKELHVAKRQVGKYVKLQRLSAGFGFVDTGSEMTYEMRWPLKSDSIAILRKLGFTD